MNKFGSGKLRFIAWAIPILFSILAIATCTGCRTIKYVDRVKTITDSSVVEQNEGLQRTLAETIERYEAERESWNKTGILFDTVYRDTGSVMRVTFFDNGKIKSAEGRIKSISLDLMDKQSELLDAHSTIDSLSIELERQEARLSKTETVTKIEKRKIFPWYLFLLFPAGLFVEYRFKLIQRLLKLIKYYL